VDLPIYRETKSALPVVVDKMRPAESETVRAMLNAVILEGASYPQSSPLTAEAFANYWLKGDAFVVRESPPPQGIHTSPSTIMGAFYLKPNFPGRCSHICNAGFIVAPERRGQGLGRLMGEAMLDLARDRGYRAVMYNLVFATNVPSLRLWESMGFQEIGRIPEGAHLPDGQYVDAVMLYKSLL
jgi:L-amino acid N-acyltransferase YncA